MTPVFKRTERVEQALEATRRYLDWRKQFVAIDPEIRGGEPVIKGLACSSEHSLSSWSSASASRPSRAAI
jgi:hypothetical protein